MGAVNPQGPGAHRRHINQQRRVTDSCTTPYGRCRTSARLLCNSSSFEQEALLPASTPEDTCTDFLLTIQQNAPCTHRRRSSPYGQAESRQLGLNSSLAKVGLPSTSQNCRQHERVPKNEANLLNFTALPRLQS